MSVTLNVQSSQDILPFIMLLDARQIKAQSDSLCTSDGFKLTIHCRRLCACVRVMYTVQIQKQMCQKLYCKGSQPCKHV